jgi:hypothetical protein
MATGICWHYTVYEKKFSLSLDKAGMQSHKAVTGYYIYFPI